MKQFFDTEFLESQVFGDGWEKTEEAAETEEVLEFVLSLEDGSRLNCRVSGVFIEQEKEYVALETEEGMIYLMGFSQGEGDELKLRPLEDEEEQETAIAAFFRMVEEEDYAMQESENEREPESERKDDGD